MPTDVNSDLGIQRSSVTAAPQHNFKLRCHKTLPWPFVQVYFKVVPTTFNISPSVIVRRTDILTFHEVNKVNLTSDYILLNASVPLVVVLQF